MFERIGETISAMVAIPTVSGRGNETQYHMKEYRECLRQCFPELFVKAKVFPVGEALLCHLIGMQGEQTLPVLFSGHMDVVPADPSGWSHEPFSGEIEGNRVWGRGSQDMKGPHCAFLSAINELLKEKWRPQRDFWLYMSCDEEVGGQTTALAAGLLEEKKLHFSVVFDEGGTICENFMGLVDGRAAMIGISEKGSLCYKITAKGHGGHAANPPRNSAIVRLAEFITELEHGNFFIREMSEGNRAMLRAMSRYAEGERKQELQAAAEDSGEYQILHRVCREADSMLGATTAFTMISGGTAFNVMPKEAVLTMNARVTAVQGKEQITEILERCARKHDLLCTLESGEDAAPEGKEEMPGYLLWKESIEKVYPGLPIIPFVLGGGTDSKHFLKLTDEVVRFSPLYAAPEQGRGVHGDDESVFIDAMQDAAACYLELLKKL